METQVAKTFQERTAGLAVWLGQAFDHDLSVENKQILLDYTKAIQNKDQSLYAHIIIEDLGTAPEDPLVGRNGFLQILNNLCDYIKTLNLKVDPLIRKLMDPGKLWCVMLVPALKK